MSNINKIRQAIPEYKCAAMLVTNEISRLYATGFATSAGALIVTEKNAWFLTDSRYIEAAEAAIKDAKVQLIGKDETLIDCIKKIVAENNIMTMGFEDSSVSYATYNEWVSAFRTELVPAQKLISNLRSVKSRDELDKLIKAQRLAEKVFEELLPMISTDMTEKDIAAEINYRSVKNGADGESFNPIVLSGKNSTKPHGVPGNEKIGKGFLTIDNGVRLDGWCSDTTRTLCIGKPDEEMVRVYDTVLKAQEAGIKAVRGGVKGKDVDTVARDLIEAAGFGEYFGHGFGHSLGLEVHETLSFSQTSKDTIPVGAAMTAEPGIYIPGKYGVRIEDTLYVTEDGSENITKLAKDLIVL